MTTLPNNAVGMSLHDIQIDQTDLPGGWQDVRELIEGGHIPGRLSRPRTKRRDEIFRAVEHVLKTKYRVVNMIVGTPECGPRAAGRVWVKLPFGERVRLVVSEKETGHD